MAIITGRSQQLLEHLTEKEDVNKQFCAKACENIVRHGNRVTKIVTGLLNFSRDSSRDELKEFPVSKILEEVKNLCTEKAARYEVRLIFADPPDTKIPCRPTEVEQVILNLINNSIDAIKDRDDRWVKVEASLSTETMEIRVTDSGRGIPPDIREKILQPFFTTKPQGKGTGLGLSISVGLIENMGGTMVLDPGSRNTCFVITLPLINEKAENHVA